MLKEQKKYSLFLLIILLSAVFSFVLEFSVFSVKKQPVFSGESVPVFSDNSSFSANGYAVNGNIFTATAEHPNLIFQNVNQTVRAICITFQSPLSKGAAVRAYNDSDGNGFREEGLIFSGKARIGTASYILSVPETTCQNLRIDIDGSFKLSDISVSNAPITLAKSRPDGISVLRTLLSAAVLSLILILIANRIVSPTNELSLNLFESLFCFACFCFYCLWALKPLNYAPDETMRYEVSQFFFAHNRLPANTETINPIWGMSYAHLPTMLCNILNYPFMKYVSLYTDDARVLLLAARMVGVLCATGTVYCTLKSAKIVFQSPARWIMVIIMAAIPQFAFLSGYVNNDMVAVFGISMILYAWLLAKQYGWNVRISVLLCFGMSFCILSYYNSYAWILCSIFVFFITYFIQYPKDYKGFAKMTAFIISLTFLLCGYLFVRHLVLYGDLLGLKTSHRFAEIYASEEFKAENRFHPATAGYSVWGMLFDLKWLKITAKSFIGCFGYMTFDLPSRFYVYYAVLFSVCTLGLIIWLIQYFVKRNRPTVFDVTLGICLVLCIVITISLSIYNSYVTDFQAQGRYCYPALPAMALLFAKGADYWLGKFKKPALAYGTAGAVCIASVAVLIESYYLVFLPT